MSRIVFADDGIAFNGRIAEERPLGGAESACVNLLNAFAARGHDVTAFTSANETLTHRSVAWRPLGEGPPNSADLYIANRSWRLIRWMPQARRLVLWIHNPARYLLKTRFLWRLWLTRPAIVFSGAYHAGTFPAWAPSGRRVIIPYGIDEPFRAAMPASEPPPPTAIFTSNPLRGLDWLIDLWVARIRPAVPTAELHIYAGASVYGGSANPKAAAMEEVLAKARAAAQHGVRVFAPRPKRELIPALAAARVMLYRGDPGETYCLAVGEAQALGIPAVVEPIGSLSERVIDGVTGAVAVGDEAFATAAIRLLADDAAWRGAHAGALQYQRGFGWDDAARAFEENFLT